MVALGAAVQFVCDKKNSPFKNQRAQTSSVGTDPLLSK
jgi:hypothetical protein